MLDQLDLVHMNGRIYDPLIGRFMSGDPLVQDPANGQNYNRYSYVLNNPTNVTDPTGFACIVVTGSNIPTCNNGGDDKVLNIPGGAKEILKGNGKGKTLEKALKETSAGTAKQDAKNPGQTSANTTPSSKTPNTVWEDAKEALLINDIQRVYVTGKKLVTDTVNYIGGNDEEKQAAGASFKANGAAYIGLGTMFLNRGRGPARSAAALSKFPSRSAALNQAKEISGFHAHNIRNG